MRRSLATLSNCAAALAPALLAVLMVHAPAKPAFSGSLVSDPSVTPSVSPCGGLEVAVHHSSPSSGSEPGCEAPERTAAEIAEARTYVAETAEPGYTMTLQGPELAIERLHPEFVVRLANAIREARSAGLPFAGVFSAYRPPAFGVGGFSDKFNSLHTYGLAVDMQGIGRPGWPGAQTWHAIAARNGVVCPYGPRDRAEWNHCQPTSVKMILAANPLRETVSAAGPSDLESMFEAGNPLIASMASAAESFARAEPTPVRALERCRRQGGEARTAGCRSRQNQAKLSRRHGARQRQTSAAREAGHSHGRGQTAGNRSRGRPTEVEIRRRLAARATAPPLPWCGSRAALGRYCKRHLMRVRWTGSCRISSRLRSKRQLDLS